MSPLDVLMSGFLSAGSDDGFQPCSESRAATELSGSGGQLWAGLFLPAPRGFPSAVSNVRSPNETDGGQKHTNSLFAHAAESWILAAEDKLRCLFLTGAQPARRPTTAGLLLP